MSNQFANQMAPTSGDASHPGPDGVPGVTGNQNQSTFTPPAVHVNPQAAIEGSSMFQRIESSGAYEGVLTQAIHVESAKGTHGIEMTFKDESGAEAGYLTLWTHNAKGEELMGNKRFQALLVCLNVSSVQPVQTTANVWDSKQESEVQKTVWQYQEILMKPIGLALQAEEYLKGNKRDFAKRMQIVASYSAESSKTAKEIINGAEKAEYIPNLLKTLTDKLMSKREKDNAIGDNAQTGLNFDPNAQSGGAASGESSVAY